MQSKVGAGLDTPDYSTRLRSAADQWMAKTIGFPSFGRRGS
jgi:hypothetical protein